MRDVKDLVSDLLRVADLTPTEAATALVELATLQSAVAARLHSTQTPGSGRPTVPQNDRLLTAGEVAGRFGRSVDWVYRHAKHWPFTRRLTRRTVRFSEAGLERFLATPTRGSNGVR